MDLLQKESFERAVSSERYDATLTIVGLRSWLILLICIGLTVLTALWACLSTIPITVSGKCLVFVPEEELEILGFFSLVSAESIKPGMEVRCQISAVDATRYGMLRAKVKEVLPYPVGPDEAHLQKIPSESLKKYLVNDSLPVNLVLIEPVRDAHTASGLLWTSKEGPPGPMPQVAVGMARVILDEVRPISYVIPSLRK